MLLLNQGKHIVYYNVNVILAIFYNLTFTVPKHYYHEDLDKLTHVFLKHRYFFSEQEIAA